MTPHAAPTVAGVDPCAIAVIADGSILYGSLIEIGHRTLLIDHEREVWDLGQPLLVAPLAVDDDPDEPTPIPDEEEEEDEDRQGGWRYSHAHPWDWDEDDDW